MTLSIDWVGLGPGSTELASLLHRDLDDTEASRDVSDAFRPRWRLRTCLSLPGASRTGPMCRHCHAGPLAGSFTNLERTEKIVLQIADASDRDSCDTPLSARRIRDHDWLNVRMGLRRLHALN